MKILVSSHCYAPSVGGIETVTDLLARQWISAGHEVRIVTNTAGPSDERQRPIVIRNPTAGRLFRELAWCDLYFQNNISLKTLWPALIARKPAVITHQTWLPEGFTGFVKRLACFFAARTVAISEAIRKQAGGDVVIPNPYENKVFATEAGTDRDRDLIFVGRLVSDKGADLVIDALGILAKRGLRPGFTIVGEGPEASFLKTRVAASLPGSRIVFAGKQSGPALASLLRRHRILIVPSRWQEPFGIVALEGIACGCAAIGSDGGGLPEAIGPCGILFPRGDSVQLANALERLLQDSSALDELRDHGGRDIHLERHSPSRISSEYMHLFERLVENHAGAPAEPASP